jgi:hypothetical protein
MTLSNSNLPIEPESLRQEFFSEIRSLIDGAKQRAAIAINTEITVLYWQVGRRIQSEILNGQRAEYGKQVILSLSSQLTQIYGKGWSEKQLRHCLRLAETFPDDQIVYTLCRQLSWSHLRLLIYMDDALKREFYIEIAQLEHWSVRQLQDRIRSMLYERTAISRKSAFKGEMELYLRYLERYEKVEGEETPIGLILCTGKNQEHVELLQLDQSNIRVADYLTALPPREVLEAKLHESIAIARRRLPDLSE